MALGIRGKLITIFVIIKVVPLILLGGIAWEAIKSFGETATIQTTAMAHGMRETITEAGKLAVANTVKALDDKARDSIERLSTDIARNVASFLYERDSEILYAASLEPNEELYRRFLANRSKPVSQHRNWIMNPNGTAWVPALKTNQHFSIRRAEIEENKKQFHYRPAENHTLGIPRPLYKEMTYISITGDEIIKVTTNPRLSTKRKNVSDSQNTYIKAEKYFDELKKLKPGEIYVSDVIGSYQTTTLIGPYTKKRTAEKGLAFTPKEVAYAGKENPQGKRFEGIVRWATPFVRAGKIHGYVTLALDHRHIMEFSDHNLPTNLRYSNISDASSGNYAFMWDYKGRNISHPRDYFIYGYDGQTGNPSIPWLADDLYKTFKESGLSYAEFEKIAPWFQNPGKKSKPSIDLKNKGQMALDCRFLNFAPQCAGWWNLTEEGGSGSFSIFWSGLWKLTTAATIPYYTGRFANSKRGFGFITIGANVDEFHRAATETKASLDNLIARQEVKTQEQEQSLLNEFSASLNKTAYGLTFYSIVMIVLVVLIAIWMANALSGRIMRLIMSLRRIKEGDLSERAKIDSHDEMGELASSLNSMTESLQELVKRNEEAVHRAEKSSRAKTDFLANMSHELRTPLNAILGFSDIMQNELLGAIKPDGYREYVDDIHTSGEHLLSLINDILDVARISSGQIEIDNEGVDLQAIIKICVRMVIDSAKEREITLNNKTSDIALFHGDRRRLKQILLNLLTNAVKFTPNKGTITITTSITASGNLAITIQDTGIGMTDDEIRIALTPFAQVQTSLAREYEGTGLGLPLAQSLVNLHGGHLDIISVPNQGTQVIITLPQERLISS